jgi:hypothetical protein
MTASSDFDRLRSIVKTLGSDQVPVSGQFALCLVPAELTAGDTDTFGWLKKRSNQGPEQADFTTLGWMKKRAPTVEAPVDPGDKISVAPKDT